ncbi:RAMP superfamily CRISPR-associated protein [Nocardiopsis alba]|uniref:RAMP superfamily CRISPR-associated protein n=1 Tax=Nocardiopsis alba TaxID=53437 RepID=UPI0036716F75
MTEVPRDPDLPRPTAVVWELTARLCLLTDAHIGAARSVSGHGSENDGVLPLDRDPITDAPRLRATTLAGLLRHELTARADHAGAVGLFGGGGPVFAPSALDLDDAHAERAEAIPVTVRTGIRVAPDTGAALPGRMWRREILPAGTLFTCHLRLWVPALAHEARLLSLLLLATRGLEGEGPGLGIGARTGRGYGAVRATRWAARRHDLTDARGWSGFHARDWAERHRQGVEALTENPGRLADLVDLGLREHGRDAVAAHVAARAALPDRARRAELRMELHVAERAAPPAGPPTGPEGLRPGLLLVGGDPAEDTRPGVDRSHRRRPVVTDPDTGATRVEPVLGDTALFALLKRIGGRLARDAAEHLGAPGERWRAWHGSWWGADSARTSSPEPAATHHGEAVPSRVRLRSVPVLAGGAPLTTARRTVDALFGDTVDGRLFTAEAHCGGSAEVVLDVIGPDDAVRGLLALLVRELATVPFDGAGAGTGGGNGGLVATRAVLTTYGDPSSPVETEGDDEGDPVDLMAVFADPEGERADVVRRWVRALHTRLTGPEEDESR